MENGFGTQDILTGRGLGLYGFGYPGGYGHGGIANPTATYVQNDANSDRISDQGMCTRELLASTVEGARNALDSLAIANEFATSRSETNSGFDRINDANLQNVITNGQSALANERRQSDLFANLSTQMNDFRAEAAKCCCDQKILTIEEANRTRELINQRALDDSHRALSQSERSRDTDRIISAIQSNCGGQTCL